MMVDGLYGRAAGRAEGAADDVQANGKHLLRLINDVLDLAKIEAGRMELALARLFGRRTWSARCARALRSLAAEKGLAFDTEFPDDLPPARGDDGRLTQCLMNLAGNALKFTRERGVAIGVALEGGDLSTASATRALAFRRRSRSMSSPSSGRSTPP